MMMDLVHGDTSSSLFVSILIIVQCSTASAGVGHTGGWRNEGSGSIQTTGVTQLEMGEGGQYFCFT